MDQTNGSSEQTKRQNCSQVAVGSKGGAILGRFLGRAVCKTKVGLLENVMGFKAVLGCVMAIIERNLPEHLFLKYNVYQCVVGL